MFVNKYIRLLVFTYDLLINAMQLVDMYMALYPQIGMQPYTSHIKSDFDKRQVYCLYIFQRTNVKNYKKAITTNM